MLSDKEGIRILINTLEAKGVKDVVISPGSRNAPLVITIEGKGTFDCVNVPDERSAGYFALGISQQTRRPTAVICSSGTAAANYLPCAAEAYFQKIPLVFITADRPVEWVDQGDGQTIRQRGIFGNHVKNAYELPQEAHHPDELWSVNRIANEAVDEAMSQPEGPVHINVPLREPLYNVISKEYEQQAREITLHRPGMSIAPDTLNRLAEEFNASRKVMILCGQMPPDPKLNHILELFADEPNVAVVTETTANQYSRKFNPCIDRVVTSFTKEEKRAFLPDLLITTGGMIVSKKIKALLRNHRPEKHWHIEESTSHFDVFQSLTDTIPISPNAFFRQLHPLVRRHQESQFSNKWLQRHFETEALHKNFLASCPWSDLKAYEVLMDFIPDSSELQMGNSTAVRYVQLFNQVRGIVYNSNRGASGIDGSVSTAAGAAWKSEQMTTLVTGDISFLYDSNGLWHKNHKGNFRVIVVNNSGGGIFRVIDGPSSTEHLEKHFETAHELSVEHLARQFGLDYYSVNNPGELEKQLPEFYMGQENAILEIKTPREENDKVLKDYFRAVESNG